MSADTPHHQSTTSSSTPALLPTASATIPYDTDLSAECLAHAERELGETHQVRQQCMLEIHQWLDANPHINAHRDAQSILHFLRGAKFRVDKAQRKMINFYRMRAERDEWYANRDPFAPELVELMDLGVFLPLRVKDEHNRQVFIIRTAAHDPKKHTQNDVFKVGKMILDLAMAADETIAVYGVVAIFDMAGVGLAHALQLPPGLIKKSVDCWECYPCLNKKLEFVNAPIYVNAFLNTFRFFMSTKLKSRIVVSGGHPTAVGRSILPPELGGTGESYAQLAEHWKVYAQQRAAWFVADDEFKSTVSPGKRSGREEGAEHAETATEAC